MRPKSMILIVIALGCGLVASIGVSQVMESRSRQAAHTGVETEKIFVAMVDVPIGEPLTSQTVKLEEWPKGKIPEGAIRKLENVESRRPRQFLYAGEPILKAKLIDSDSIGGAAERIPKGFRVCSVKVTMDSAASGLILPGDRVDVLLFLKRQGEIAETGARTILKDVTVFAVNASIDRMTDREGSVITAKTVSLLVKPPHVEKLMLATELGKLRLSLRRADDDTEETSSGATLADLISSEKADSEFRQGEGEQLAAAPPAQPPASSSILGFLDKMKASGTAAGAPPVGSGEPVRVMHIHTPDGIDRYHWDDPKQLPRELETADTGGWTPASTGEADADGDVDAGQQDAATEDTGEDAGNEPFDDDTVSEPMVD